MNLWFVGYVLFIVLRLVILSVNVITGVINMYRLDRCGEQFQSERPLTSRPGLPSCQPYQHFIIA